MSVDFVYYRVRREIDSLWNTESYTLFSIFMFSFGLVYIMSCLCFIFVNIRIRLKRHVLKVRWQFVFLVFIV